MSNKTVSLAALFAAYAASAHTQTIITAWNFKNDYVAPGSGLDFSSSPAPSFGFGTARALGMSNYYGGTNSIDGSYLLSRPEGSADDYAWCIAGDSTKNWCEGNGWSSLAPIGSQGAEFEVSTVGFDNIQISFDVGTTAQSERNLEVEYTINGSTWLNATLTSAGSLGTLEDNTCSHDTVYGSYVELGPGWNNGITAVLSGISGVNDEAHFGFRIVNASTGADDVNVAGCGFNNDRPGDWCFGNVGNTCIPEPSTLAIASLGGLSLFLLRRMKQTNWGLTEPPECQQMFFFAQMY